MESKTKPIVVFVLGGPGSGKGTQCQKIVDDFGFVHLSAGELLRKEMDSDSMNGSLISDLIKEGKIVPSHITVSLLQKAMENSEKKKFLVDGFPRNFENNDFWEKVMDKVVYTPFLLFFECPESVMEERLLSRGKVSGRLDDNLESIRKRFNTFRNETLPVIEYYEKKNRVIKVDSDRNPTVIFESLQGIFEALKSV